MTWGKVDDNLAFHPKVVMVGNEAMGVWVRALSWGMQQLTDGFIPTEIVMAIKGGSVASELVAKGLWHEVVGGYQFNDWCDYQPLRVDVLAAREKSVRAKSEAGKKGASARWNGKPDGKRMAEGMADAMAEPMADAWQKVWQNDGPDPTRPDPLSKERVRATRITPTFALDESMTLWAKGVGLTVDLKVETAKFVDYWTAESGAKAVKRDWVAAWRNWMRRAQEYRPATADIDPWAGKEHLGFAE